MIIEKISDLRKIGITVLIVEQNARLSLAMSDRGYIFSNGKVQQQIVGAVGKEDLTEAINKLL